MQPNMRIPSPQLPLWTRCWQVKEYILSHKKLCMFSVPLTMCYLIQYGQYFQPIGTTVMDTEVLKEPRGFIRCIEWLFAMIAFATCANFSTECAYEITCKPSTGLGTVKVSHQIYYPFK